MKLILLLLLVSPLSVFAKSLNCHDEVLEFKAKVQLDAPISLQVTSKKLYRNSQGNQSKVLNLILDQRIDCPDNHTCYKVSDVFKRYKVDIPNSVNTSTQEEMVFFEVLDDWNGYNYMFLPYCSIED